MVALSGADEVGEAALRALSKLDQVLPPKLRAIVTAVDDATFAIPRGRSVVDLHVLQLLATAQRDHTLVCISYRKHADERTAREVEPARLMTQGEHWYLQGYDRKRDDWRVFRIDRMSEVSSTIWNFQPRRAPSIGFDRDLASRYECVARIEMAVSPERLARRVPAPYLDQLEPTERGCQFLTGAPTWDDLAWHMLWVSRDLDVSLTILEGPGAESFRSALARIASQANNLATAFTEA
ncbi:helix-turn-helix transcriptional regulator [Corynebacterium lubricantis]|uniref:helix-turn-helix transcriptional regulator n=1 Tax=Corynebacterium lubricantis TaxID=541095 RepID=UPI00037562A5|nr:WYL domain-containing protein [Corynebacterium lubricantis]